MVLRAVSLRRTLLVPSVKHQKFKVHQAQVCHQHKAAATLASQLQSPVLQAIMLTSQQLVCHPQQLSSTLAPKLAIADRCPVPAHPVMKATIQPPKPPQYDSSLNQLVAQPSRLTMQATMLTHPQLGPHLQARKRRPLVAQPNKLAAQASKLIAQAWPSKLKAQPTMLTHPQLEPRLQARHLAILPSRLMGQAWPSKLTVLAIMPTLPQLGPHLQARSLLPLATQPSKLTAHASSHQQLLQAIMHTNP